MSVVETNTMPWELEMCSRVAANFIAYGPETMAYTKRYYEVRRPDGELIVAAGVALWSFVRPPELWLLLGARFNDNLRENLRITRAATALPRATYANLCCDVAKNNEAELHFAKFCGHVETGQPSLRPNGNNYIQFKVM